MKVKVKGLVFVGFAAAVFATSARADNATDAKTVTSKLYVDNKIAATATINYGGSDHANTSTNNTAVTGTGTVGTVKYTKISNDSSDIDTTAGENVLVTGKAVAGAIEDLSNDISSIDVDGDEEYITVTDGTGNDAGTFTVGPKNTPASTSTGITGTLTNNIPAALTDAQQKTLVTAAAVKDLVEFETTAGTTKITSSSTNGKVPTSKSVYDFVTKGKHYQPKAPTTDGTSLYLGHNTVTTSNNTTTNTADWKKLEAVATGTQATTDYVTIKEDSGVYKINIPAAQLTSATTDFTGTVTSGVWGGPTDAQKAKLVKAETINSLIDKETTIGTTTITDAAAGNTTVPTSKNVYDFVTNAISDAAGDYQPKVDNSNAGKLMVGFNTATTSNGTTTYSSDWKKLEDAVTGTQASTDYVTIKEDSGVYKINIPTAQLATAATGLVNANATSGAVTALTSTTKVKLVEAQAVEALVAYETSVGTTTITSANSGNGKVPTVKNVYDFVTDQIATINPGGLTIPAPTGDCAYVASGDTGINPTNERACALVLVYDANATNHLKLEWVKMAQDI